MMQSPEPGVDIATAATLFQAIAQSKEGFALCDAKGCYTYMNAEHLRMFGFEGLHEVLGRPWTILYDEAEVTLIKQEVLPVIAQSGSWNGQLMARRRDGSSFHEDLTLSMLPGGGIVCNCRDRSALVELYQRLAQSERFLREFSDSLPLGVVIRDADGFCSFVNRSAAAFQGGALRLALGHRLQDLLSADLAAVFTSRDAEVVRTGQPVHFEAEVPLASEKAVFAFTLLPVSKISGRVQTLGLLWEDITVRRRHEREILASLEHQRDLLRLRGEFVSLVSHEFRTPLSAIQTSNFLIKKASANQLDAKLARYLALQDQAIQTLRHLVDQVLNLNRAENLNSDEDLVPVRPDQVLRELVDQANLANETTRVHLRHDLPPKMTLLVDSRLFRAAIENLVSNALKYSDPATPVTVEAQARDGLLTITVRDGGRGIPAAEQRRLFENFFRGSNVGSVAGTGLGLAIVRRAAEFHGGQVSFESQEGTGSAFRLEIPSPTRPRVLPPARPPEVRA